ncbi:YadA-like family protein, partial [Campylobacter sp. VBCF_05 NA6]|uniref:YadA family autotransporter adhesin n=1 Tax=unclassified Campylobacter TaxID=2593542 RepID=UPI0022E9F40A
TVAKGKDTLDNKEPGRIIYKTTNNEGNEITLQVATMDDGLKFQGDYDGEVAKKLNEKQNIKGNHTAGKDSLTNGNIGVVNEGGDLIIKLAQNIDLGKDGSVKAGDTTINNDGLTIANGPTITKNNVDMGGNQIHNVAKGTADDDAVNVSQLKEVEGKIKAPNTVSSENGSVKIAETTNADGGKNYDLKVATKQNSDGTVSMVTYDDNGKEIDSPVQIKNVARGVDGTDAVNVDQLKDYIIGSTDDPEGNKNIHYDTVNIDGKDYEVVVDKNNQPLLKTYNVHTQTEYWTNSVAEAISKMNEQGIKFFHTNDGKVIPEEQARNNVDSSAAGSYSTAIGYQASVGANGTNSIAIGVGSTVTGSNSIAIGTGHQITGNNSGAFGDPATVNADGSYSIGNNNTIQVDATDTFVIGNNITSTVADSLFLGSRTAYVADDEGRTNRTKGNTTGYNSAEVKARNANGQPVTIGVKDFAGGNQVKGVVSVGNANETRRIQNVAPGLISKDSTDAINGSQLYSAIEGIAEHLGNNITNINQRIDNVRDEARAGVASAIAIGNLPQSTIPGKGMLSVGTGYYQDEGALSIGLSKMSDNGKWVFKSSISVDTQDNIGAGASLGFHF